MKNGKPFALCLMTAFLLALLLTACGGAGQTAAEPPAPVGGTLMEDVVGEVYANSPVFGSPTLERYQIRSITFLSDTADAPADSWDVSQEQNGSVVAWAVENGELYDLFIASDGGVIAPENCKSMFCGYGNVESIAFNSAFDTSHVTNMNNMFTWCNSLTTLDLSGFDTSNVTDMSNMFTQCHFLQLDLSGFNTSNVENMSGMFAGCYVMTTLDVSGFDTSNVTNTAHMFWGCNRLTSLDISGFDTSNVETVEAMFYECHVVTEEDVSKLDLSNATDADLIFNSELLGYEGYISDGREYISETSGE